MKERIILLIFLVVIHNSLIAKKISEPTYITSKRMEIIKQGEITSFIGDVVLTQGKSTIKSDIMKNYEKDGYVIGKGNISIVDKSQPDMTIKGYGQRIFYNKNTKYGILSGKPKVVRINNKDPNDNITITGERIKTYLKENKVLVEKNAYVKHSQIEATAGLIDYDFVNKKIYLEESPFVNQNTDDVNGQYWADKIEVDVEKEKIFLKGNVKATIYSQKYFNFEKDLNYK